MELQSGFLFCDLSFLCFKSHNRKVFSSVVVVRSQHLDSVVARECSVET